MHPRRDVPRVGDLEHHRVVDLELRQLLEARRRQDDLVRELELVDVALLLGAAQRDAVAAERVGERAPAEAAAAAAAEAEGIEARRRSRCRTAPLSARIANAVRVRGVRSLRSSDELPRRPARRARLCVPSLRPTLTAILHPAASAQFPMADVLKFEPLTGSVDVGFLTELAKKKLEEFKLSDAPVPIRGGFTGAARRDASSPFCVAADAFAPPASSVPPSLCVAPGTLLNANTLEDFKEMDKAAVLERGAAALWEARHERPRVRRAGAPPSPSRFSRSPTSRRTSSTTGLRSRRSRSTRRRAPPRPGGARRRPRFGADPAAARGLRLPLPRAAEAARRPSSPSAAPAAARLSPSRPLSKFREWAACSTPPSRRRGVADVARGELLLAAATDFGVADRATSSPSSPSSRRRASRRTSPFSAIARRRPAPPSTPPPRRPRARRRRHAAAAGAERPNAVGWAKNAAGKLGARMMDLSRQMRPEALAEASVDLNLQLMRGADAAAGTTRRRATRGPPRRRRSAARSRAASRLGRAQDHAGRFGRRLVLQPRAAVALQFCGLRRRPDAKGGGGGKSAAHHLPVGGCVVAPFGDPDARPPRDGRGRAGSGEVRLR